MFCAASNDATPIQGGNDCLILLDHVSVIDEIGSLSLLVVLEGIPDHAHVSSVVLLVCNACEPGVCVCVQHLKDLYFGFCHRAGRYHIDIIPCMCNNRQDCR